MTNIAPPYDLTAEESVLGSILLSDVSITKLIVDLRLSAAMFYRDLHGRIWDAMVALAMAGERVDAVTLRARLEATGVPKRDLGIIDQLPGVPPMAGNVLAYARRVIELAEWRQVRTAALELQAAVASQDSDRRHSAEGMLNIAQRPAGDTRSPETLAEDVWRHLEGKTVPAWSTPWSDLNEAMGGGLRAGEVTLLGGWTSHGKSVATDQLLRWCASKGAKVHLYINEMAPTMRALRIVSAMTEIPQGDLARPRRLTDGNRTAVMRMLSEGFPFGITQVTDWPAEDVARDIRFRGWDVCALDLVHRLPFREERDLAQISSTLNAAAQAAGTHLIAVVHLNEARAVSSVLPAPVLRDIRASGMLKNDADNVLFVHRTEEESPEGVTTRSDEAQLYLQKCRNGYLKSIDLRFDARRLRFLQTASNLSSFDRRAGSDKGA